MIKEKPLNDHGHEDIDDAGELVPPPYVPVGAYFPFAGAAAPAGFLLCNGAAVSRITYAELFEVIGEAYGAGDGSTTFNVPDLRGRTPFGYKSTDAAFNALGKTGGAKDIDIAHVHSNNPPNATTTGPSATIAIQAGGGTTVAEYRHNHDLNIGAFDSASALSNNWSILPPYEVGNYIIKI